MSESALIALAGIGVVGIVCQWLAWWVKLPAILFLLLAGILAGPVGGWLNPDTLFGDLLLPLVSLAVGVILFEGSLTLRLDEIRGLERVVQRLVSVGLLVTWLVTALATRWLLGLSWELAFLFGAVTVVTGPTVIVPMLRTVRPTAHVSNILRWEGIVIDPVGALLAVLVFEFLVSGQGADALGHSLLVFLKILLVGSLLGAAAGQALGMALRHHWLPEYLHNVATLALVFGVFALSQQLEEESGLLAVTVMGMWLANMPRVPVDDILDFKESLSVFLISGLFIVLAARMDLGQVASLGWGALGVLAFMQFLARPLKVAVATAGTDLSWRERALLAWIAPRGIVAAAVASLFALRLSESGLARAELLVPLTFLVILGTVGLQSATARPLARWLGVAEPEPRGFLLVGANPVARAVAAGLQRCGYSVLLADTQWEPIREARMQGFATYFGNPVSEHADRHLDLVGLGRLLALSPRSESNTMAALRYRPEFGAGNVFMLGAREDRLGEPGRLSRTHSPPAGMRLFGREVTYGHLAAMLVRGAEVHDTRISDSFDFDDYYRRYGKRAVPLFALDPRGHLRPFTADTPPQPRAGWRVVALIEPEPEPQPQPEAES
jgi:NhaP-type Na+/H+ or K+/H+ antiporter